MLDNHDTDPAATCDDTATHAPPMHAAPVFIVNPQAAPCDVVDFVNGTHDAIAEMLDSATLQGGMSGQMAYLMEQLFHIREAALSRLMQPLKGNTGEQAAS